jgi:hypothetical protein
MKGYARILWVLSAGGFMLFLCCCGEKPPLRLTTAQRDQVDTLYLRSINQKGLSLQMDSICTANRPAKVQHLVDSMLQVRRAEEEELRKRYGR